MIYKLCRLEQTSAGRREGNYSIRAAAGFFNYIDTIMHVHDHHTQKSRTRAHLDRSRLSTKHVRQYRIFGTNGNTEVLVDFKDDGIIVSECMLLSKSDPTDLRTKLFAPLSQRPMQKPNCVDLVLDCPSSADSNAWPASIKAADWDDATSLIGSTTTAVESLKRDDEIACSAPKISPYSSDERVHVTVKINPNRLTIKCFAVQLFLSD
eukprot:scaffold46220_cov34-Cyclotella_meneghiniana.AAC.1